MGIPIIFIHTGDPYYLDFSLNQAHVSNPESDIYLITDVLTHKYDFIKYIDIKSLRYEADKFEEVYKHMSTNSYQAELFCFQRWFVLKEFCSKNQLNSFLYLDSDMMLYCDANSTFSKFNSYQFTITNKQGPQCCYFSSLSHLDNFCNFMIKLYNDNDYKGRFELKYSEHLAKQLNGGVCDMTAFLEYQNDYPQAAKDLSLIENQEVFDDNFNVSDGFCTEKIGKQISIEHKFPYGVLKEGHQKIRFNTLHFQGPAKKYIYKFYLGNNLNSLKRKIGFDLFLLDHYTLFRIFRRLGYKIFEY